MKAEIKADLLNTDAGRSANAILRKCVHCGFCLATCPTYQVLGDERDSPRGRIYLIKSLLEQDIDSSVVQTHLDRCLTCRACETTCPSGVDYGHLLDIGREELAKDPNNLSVYDRFVRYLLRKWLTQRRLFDSTIALARAFRFLLPASVRSKLANRPQQLASCAEDHTNLPKVILVRGCVQPSLTPKTNLLTKQLLTRLGINAIEVHQEQCCGAISHHLAASNEAKQFMRANIDAWWPEIEQGADAIISTASGCGIMLKDYARLLGNDAQYAEKARCISDKVCDLSEYIGNTVLSDLKSTGEYQRVAFHSPCTLQHGQNITGVVESLLQACGYELLPVSDSHLCCGSAGTYSVLQSSLSKQLQDRKIQSLEKVKPDVIATANIGCQLHLQEATDIPVKHWVELIQ